LNDFDNGFLGFAALHPRLYAVGRFAGFTNFLVLSSLNVSFIVLDAVCFQELNEFIPK